MATIELTQGKVTLVDDDIFNELSQYKWYYAEGYARRTIRVNGKQKILRMHRQIMDTPIGLEVDHINGNTLDNRLVNLRNCLKRQNNMNCSKKRKASSKFKGVTKHNEKWWRARLTFNGKLIQLGLFLNEREAAAAYNTAAVKYFGEYAYLNKL